MHMRWHELLFMHWPVPVDVLRAAPFGPPPPLTIDTFDGQAWIGVVPFRMSGVRPRGIPAAPMLSAFPELNVRTYVTAGGKPGVWFYSLDAASGLAVRLARRFFHLRYMHARMRSRLIDGATVEYDSMRTHRGEPAGAFRGRYRPAGPAALAPPGSLEHFLTERYCLYCADPLGRVFRGEINHPRWLLAPAEAEIETNTMLAAAGLPQAVGLRRPHLLYSEGFSVPAWWPARLDD